MSAREFKMPFGKYKSETLEEIYVEDLEYLEWLRNTARQGDESDPLVQTIDQCFKEMRNVRICQ